MRKNIFLFWLQGWEKAPYLQKKVLESWFINNPDWNIELIDINNLENYVDDINYIYDKKKEISPQAKSDIIRLSLLKNYGGVWADSTLLCIQPLDNWVFNAIKQSGIWMYHGHGAGLSSYEGPASWFIISEKNSYIIEKWKKKCDKFWKKKNKSIDYFWMDNLFKNLLFSDKKFKELWTNTPYLYCEKKGSSHTLAEYNFKMDENNKSLKKLIYEKPPYVIKLSSDINKLFPKLEGNKFKKSNAYFAISISKRKFVYLHEFESPIIRPAPFLTKPYIIKFFIYYLKKFLKKIMLKNIDKNIF